MAIATLNGNVLQVHKTSNRQKDTLHYFVRFFPFQKSPEEFRFDYREGTFELKERETSAREKDLMIHCIQALELSEAFHD